MKAHEYCDALSRVSTIYMKNPISLSDIAEFIRIYPNDDSTTKVRLVFDASKFGPNEEVNAYTTDNGTVLWIGKNSK